MKNKDYYVYVHKRNDTSVVFYVGHGRTTRAFQDAANKTKDWKVINEEASGHTVEFLHEGLTKEQAVELEHKYISEPKPEWRLVNKRLPTKAYELDFNVLNETFYYDESSPSGLRYKKNSYKNKGAISKRVGDVAGNVKLNPNGTPRGWKLKLTINGIKCDLNVHRIIWVLLNGSIDNSMVVDHADGNPLNNKADNLRLATYRENARNKKPKISDTFSKKGDSYCVSLIDNSGNRINKTASVVKYGDDLAKAILATWKLYMLTSEEFSGYSDRHVNVELLHKYIDEVRLWQ